MNSQQNPAQVTPNHSENSPLPQDNVRWLNEDEAELWYSLREFIWGFPSTLDRQLLHDSSLSSGEYSVMATLSDAPDHRVRAGELAEALGWERSRLSHLLRRMEERDLVERAPSKGHDRRAQDVILTPYGWEVLRSAAPDHVTFVRETVFDPLTPEEHTQLLDMLVRINRACDEQNARRKG